MIIFNNIKSMIEVTLFLHRIIIDIIFINIIINHIT